jgi:hypothetical protein
MKTIIATLLAASLLAGCAALRTNTASMPPNQYGGPAINQTEAIGLASYALKDPANTAGNPALAARAIAAEDWLAGQNRLTGEFGTYGPVNEEPWSVFRQQVRDAIGVAPDAPSQDLVDRMLATSAALRGGDTAAAERQLSDPIFTKGPQATLAALSNLPPFSGRDYAFRDLNRNDNLNTGHCDFGPNC